MSDIAGLLNAVQPGDPAAARQLLPLVYDDLRRLAVHRLAHGRTGAWGSTGSPPACPG
jgi:hypothetical protein